jgi:hypothetical protein
MIFHDVKFKFIYHYLDDLVIYSKDFDQHLQHISQVLSRLRKAGLTVKPSKVVFAVKEISFLGYHVSPLGGSIDPGRTQAIRDFPPPRDVKGIARFLGMVNFYHKFIPNLADVDAPLNILRRKGAKFVWQEAQQKAFDTLKRAIANLPCLADGRFFQDVYFANGCEWCSAGGCIVPGNRRLSSAHRVRLTYPEYPRKEGVIGL